MPPNLALLRSVFKLAMARVSSQAMILTAGRNSLITSEANKEGPVPLHGMTLSSVCSLSVFPHPLLQFNLHLPSYTSSSLHENDGLLCLHVMPPTSRAVFLGRTFASGIKKDPEHFDVKPDDGEVFHEMTTPFSQLAADEYQFFKAGKVEVPVLNELEVAFVCQKLRVFEVDSHEIWVVKVLEVLFPNGGKQREKLGGLLYFDRGFHSVGSPISESEK